MITWKLSSYNHEHSIDVRTSNIPRIEFEEVQVWSPPGYNAAYIAGSHHWLPLDIVPEDCDKLVKFFDTHPAAIWMEAIQIPEEDATSFYTARVILMLDGKRLHIGEATRKVEDAITI